MISCHRPPFGDSLSLMPIHKIYSKRKKMESGELPDVFQYKHIPTGLRNQIANNMESLYKGSGTSMYDWVESTLANEYGLRSLSTISGVSGSNSGSTVDSFVTKVASTDQVLDVVELAYGPMFKEAQRRYSNYYRDTTLQESIREMNYRFREHGVGYQLESGVVIKVDSQMVHSEVTKPALKFLSDPIYVGANEEFLTALEHYYKRRYKECMVESLKAFESCMKVICDKRGWSYKVGANASQLISIILREELIPNFMQTHFTSLKSTLESGVPTLRNKMGGHGQGSEQADVPDYLAAHILHLTASNILLLARANEEL